MEEDHIPVVTFYKEREPDIVVRVNMNNPTAIHYIEKIGIMDEKRNGLICKEFRSVDKIFEAQFYSANIPEIKRTLRSTRNAAFTIYGLKSSKSLNSFKYNPTY
jgi:hypothetical protein